MFKPLLRTLPALSGNIKIGCSLSDYHKLSSTDNIDWECYVRLAKLLPLSSQLAQRNVECNLLYSSYEYDIQKYFRYYSSVFYDDCFEFDKNNLIEIDKTKAQKNRNTDFELGCKRVSYLKNDAQFAFYAPVYLESIDDMPDYFKIHITLKNNKYTIERNLKINISKEDKRNYLNIYLKRYLNNLDSNVIFCNTNANQATYYGIDLIKGGFTKTVDHIVAKAWTRQNTINNFDAIVTNGFKRNSIIMRQILPFCWYFNVNDMLSDEEKERFSNCSLYITGSWFKNNIEQSFYNIDTNYLTFFDYPYMINTANGIFSYKDTGNNIMNMEYPSLNESMYQGYRYSNKLNLKYNRWKLKYSNDTHPYVTNLSPAFSINQKSIYKYGGFPEKYSPINVITDTNNNIILPIGNALNSIDSPYYNDYKLVTNYINIINNNASTWYELVNNLNDIYTKDIWGDVQDDKVYYKGILYDFTKIYDTYPALKNKIDKFAVIVNLHYNVLSQEDINNIMKADMSIFNTTKYITDRTAWISERVQDGFSSGEFNKLPVFYNTESTFNKGNAQLVFDKLYIKDENGGGDFIDMLSLGYNPYEINKYYKYSDIIYNFNSTNGYYDNIIDKLTKQENFNEYFKDGYEMLPVYKLNNVLHQNKKDIMFEGEADQQWILDNLYFSQHGNYYKAPYDRDTINILFKEYGNVDKMIPLYLKGKFISKANFVSMLYFIYGDYWHQYESIFNNLVVYEYHPRVKDETSATYASDVYIQKDIAVGDNYGNNIPSGKIDNDVLYVDRYNLTHVLNNYNRRFPEHACTIPSETSADTYEFYAKFLNLKHILFYVSELYKNANNIEDIEELAKSLYIRNRIIHGNANTENLVFKDSYISILDLYDKFRPLSQEEKIEILTSGITLDIEQHPNDEFSNELEDIITTDIELYEQLSNTGIYRKVNDKIYSTQTYKLHAYAETTPVYWVCKRFNCKHPVLFNDNGTINLTSCADYRAGGSEEGGTMYYGYKLTEYHSDDFYYRPDLYVYSNSKYVPLLDYIKNPDLYVQTTYEYELVSMKEALSSWQDNDGTSFYYATVKNMDSVEDDLRYHSRLRAANKEYHEININNLYNGESFEYDSLLPDYLYYENNLININRRTEVKREDEYVPFIVDKTKLLEDTDYISTLPTLYNIITQYDAVSNEEAKLFETLYVYDEGTSCYVVYVPDETTNQVTLYKATEVYAEYTFDNNLTDETVKEIPALYTLNVYSYNFETEEDLEHFPQLYTRIERTYSILSKPELLNYINYDTIKILLSEDLNNVSLSDLNIGNGRHDSNKELGFDNIDVIDEDIFNGLLEIQKELRNIIVRINNLIYSKSYLTGEYNKYNKKFTGINDFEILDSIQMKIAIIKGDIKLITYTIDDNGEFVEHNYDDDKYYVMRVPTDDDWEDYLKETISQFLSDLQYHENTNYYTMSDMYNQTHDLDDIIGIKDINGATKSNFTFEVVYKKKFNKINKKLFDLINLTDDSRPYKDLYIYRLYKADEYPSSLRMMYTNKLSDLLDYKSIHYSLYPLFDDIMLQDKEYSVIYSEYNQANIYKTIVGNDENYRYNLSDIMYMYDISGINYQKEYEITYNGQHRYAYTKKYYDMLASSNNPEDAAKLVNHMILPTYSLVNNCYSNISYLSDSISIYNKFNINTYSFVEHTAYTYSYNVNELVSVYKNGSYYTELDEVEHEGYGIKDTYTTYGFILIDAYMDNTNSSLNIVDTKYKKKKYYTYINEHYIYDPNFNVMDSFNLLVPFAKINMIDNLLNFDDVIIHPSKCIFDTYYKQVPLVDNNGNTYSYNISMHENRIDTLTLQRYFDSIVPYIPETVVINSTYCMKFKDYKYSTDNINYTNDVFYTEDINMYNYNNIRVYDTYGSYTMYTPIEYKHLNDNKLINLPEYFEIPIKGKFTYDELIDLEREEIVIEKFKNYVLMTKLNQFDDNEILFLYNRYKVEYDTVCVGLNAVKTQKLYTLTYKFTLL